MSLALILAAMLSSAPVDRSLSETDRLRELEIALRAAQSRGEIDRTEATNLHLGIARVRRKMALMGMQVGYRQRVRLRERIDRLFAQLETRRAPTSAESRPGK